MIRKTTPVLALLLALGWAGSSDALARPVFIPPISLGEPGQIDADLSRRFRQAVALRVPARAAWQLRRPDPEACRGGCRVVAIKGRRDPRPRFTLRVYDLPGGEVIGAARVQVPAGTALPVLADALLLKTSFLLGLDLGAPPPPPPPPPPLPALPDRAAPPPPAAPALSVHRRSARAVPRRFELGVGPTSLVGPSRQMASVGAELTAALRLWGPLTLKAVAGYQDAGRFNVDAVGFRAAPLHLLVGAQWTWRWWQLGIFGGGTALFVWADADSYDYGASARMSGLTFGITLELRVALRVHPRWSIGLGLRASYLLSELDTEFDFGYDQVQFAISRVMIQPSLDVTVRF